jgi:hypothetical protein
MILVGESDGPQEMEKIVHIQIAIGLIDEWKGSSGIGPSVPFDVWLKHEAKKNYLRT